MAIINTRRQHPVGQGFFHTASLCENGQKGLFYVYDCGAMARYATQRKREIKNHLKRVGARSRLDLLFISHVHADHLNGLEYLLNGTDGLHVDTIVLPLIDVADRLIAFARTAAEDPASAQSDFYRDLVVDPGEALGRFQPRQIIFVQPGKRGDEAPDGEGRPLSPPDRPEVFGGDPGEGGMTWKLAGRGRIAQLELLTVQGINGSPFTVMQLVIHDTLAIVSSTSQGEWLLAPFVDPTITTHRKRFLEELARQCQVSESQLDVWLTVTANVRTLVTTDLKFLKAAYEAVTGKHKLNITSLCLYSGPAPGSSKTLDRLHTGEFGCVHAYVTGPAIRIAWLATGDAALEDTKRRSDFFGHYGQLMQEVATLTLPHHGSYYNFHVDILNTINPRFCVAAADSFGNYKHPGSHVVKAVFSLPAVLQVVTSSEPSVVSEQAILG